MVNERDITRLKYARGADALQARFRGVLEAVPDAMVVVDVDGRIALVNSETERLFGYTRDELLGNTVELLIPERYRHAHPGHRAGYFLAPRRRSMGVALELAGRRQDGREFPVDISLSPLEVDGVTLVIAAIRDVSARKQSTEAQVQTVREASRLKSEFLANMSHELRTPLNAIIGFAELMHDGKVGAVSARQQEYLDDILTSSRHLLQLINDVLDLSKVEAGKMEFRPEPVDLAKLIREVKDILRTLAAQKQIRVEVEIDAGVTGVLADPAKLKQVLYNYLSNALKFTPDDGRVVVRVVPEGPEAFRLEVEDTGIGIRPEDMDRLFTEFQQLDAGMAKQHAGTGLGLALTKRVVEAQGGRVEARSAPGKGSLFSAVLPRITRQAVGEQPAASHPGPTAAAFRVLVIEDNPRDQERITRILSAAGYAVEAVATGAEGLASCRDRRFDAITLDLLLPDMHGRELLQAIRKGGPNRDTPVIVVTIVSDKAVLASCRVDDLLCKPIRGTELLESLRRATVTPGGSQPILVIDDDPAALEQVGRSLLELGYRPICVSTADALRRGLEEPPAAVVVDPLTTELDGFAFLSQFRKSPAGRRVPIILCTLREIAPAELGRHLASARSILQQGEGGAMLIEAVAEAGGQRRGR